MWKENLVHAEKNAFAHGMSGIKDELWKTAKKLKMSEASTERLAGEVFAMACGVSSEQQAVLRAAEATRGFAGVIDEELES